MKTSGQSTAERSTTTHAEDVTHVCKWVESPFREPPYCRDSARRYPSRLPAQMVSLLPSCHRPATSSAICDASFHRRMHSARRHNHSLEGLSTLLHDTYCDSLTLDKS
ncbi:hypothetical protein Bbelb_423220 [Branchiostoma belcheri]|nr:hypothetical protein Bbelb_423220 [Branchiostoma belcheri]